MDEADVILFVVDVMNGVTDLDMQVAAILRRANSPVIMVANKTDNHDLQYNAPEFYKLGLGDPYFFNFYKAYYLLPFDINIHLPVDQFLPSLDFL